MREQLVPRAATDQDAVRLADFLNTCTLAYQGVARSSSADAQALLYEHSTDPAVDSRVVLGHDEIVGFARVWQASDEEVRLYARTHPDAVGRGVGSVLLEFCEGRARELTRGRRELTTTSWAADERAPELLELRGFSPVRYFLQMKIAASAIPSPGAWPAGVDVEPFSAGAVEDAAVYGAWRSAFAGHWGRARPGRVGILGGAARCGARGLSLRPVALVHRQARRGRRGVLVLRAERRAGSGCRARRGGCAPRAGPRLCAPHAQLPRASGERSNRDRARRRHRERNERASSLPQGRDEAAAVVHDLGQGDSWAPEVERVGLVLHVLGAVGEPHELEAVGARRGGERRRSSGRPRGRGRPGEAPSPCLGARFRSRGSARPARRRASRAPRLRRGSSRPRCRGSRAGARPPPRARPPRARGCVRRSADGARPARAAGTPFRSAH